MEVFLCTTADTGIRVDMAAACSSRWRVELGKRVADSLGVVRPVDAGCSRLEFQRQRRLYADSKAKDPIYILTDDDCLLGPKSPIAPVLDLMQRYPEFGILSLMPSNATINPWTPEGYTAVLNDEVMEHVSVGGVRFCRKGILQDWPPMDGPGYDGIHSKAIREAGYRVGYARKIKYNHLGEGYSTVWGC